MASGELKDRCAPGLLPDILRRSEDSPGGEASAKSLGGSLLSRHRADGAAPSAGCCEPSITFRRAGDPRKSACEAAQKFQRLDDGE